MRGQLRTIVRAVRVSPQRRRSWFDIVEFSLRHASEKLEEVAKILILDVTTRWSSTHQMLRKFCQLFLYVLHSFIEGRTCDHVPRRNQRLCLKDKGTA